MHVNSRRLLIFAFAVTLVVGPMMPVFAAYSECTRYVSDHTAGKQNLGTEQNLHCGEYGVSCAHCFAVTPASLPTTTHSIGAPGSVVPILKPSLAVALHTRPPQALV